MRLRKRHVLILAALLIAGGVGWRMMASETPTTEPVFTQVRLGTVSQSVLASGMLEARELVSVGARVSGQIETLAVALGDKVEAGQLIASIDSQDQQNNLRQTEAALANIDAQIASKEANLTRARLSLKRQSGLGQSRLVTAEAVELAEAEVLMQEAELASLKAQRSSAEVNVATARVGLERTRITAPISGTIVAVVVKQGQTVNSSQAAPTIVKIADLATMVVKAEISEADVMNVKAGQNVTFTTLGAPQKPFQAVVREIEPAPAAIADSDTIASDAAIYYNALLEVDNPEGDLRIGMTAQIAIELGRAENVLVVPAAAIQREDGTSQVRVWTGTGSRPESREVVTGLDNKVDVEIREGLIEGDRVVIGSRAIGSTRSTGAAGGGGGGRGPRMPSMF